MHLLYEFAPLSKLAVILLGNDSTSLRELEKSVQTINSKKAHWNQQDSEELVSGYERQLSDARKNRKLAENELKALRESDVFIHTNKFGRYSGTLQEIAQQAFTETSQYGWLKDRHFEALSSNEIKNLSADVFVKKWHEWSVVELFNSQPSLLELDYLPEPELFSKLIQDHNKKAQDLTALEHRFNQELYTIISSTDIEKITEIHESVDPILSGLRNLKQHIYVWAYDAGKQIVAEQDRSWRELYNLTRRELGAIEKTLSSVSLIEVAGIQDDQIRYIKGFVKNAIPYAKKGKKLKKSIFHPKEFKDAVKSLEGILIDGHPIDSLDKLKLLDQWLKVKDSLNTIFVHWRNYANPPADSFSIQVANYHDLLEPLELALDLHEKVQKAQVLIDSLAKFSAPVWHDVDDLECFSRAFEFLFHTKDFDEINHQINKHKETARSLETEQLEKAITDHKSQDYQTEYYQLVRQNKRYKNKRILLEIAKSFRSKLPETFEKFKDSDDVNLWDSRLKMLTEAIQWANVSNWIGELCDPEATQRINTRLDAYTHEEQKLLGQIAEEKAWSYCISRLGDSQRQSLVAWLQAIEKVGKGTGKNAETYRRVARQKLIECRSAIPAWVMPLHRVVDTVDAKPEVFDVAIIDEASQSGSEALILNYIAKKVIVVGDDKQIRPQNIGVNFDDVEYLRQRYINNIPHSEAFDMKSSYFSQAEIRFPDQVSLKEHFRCMPEIIQFSNKHFYSSAPLIPLRQFGGDRLEPVVTEYVEDGFRVGTSGKTYNEPEAKRLVERVAECCSDPAYDGKTFGIITLLGHQQAALIEELLLNEIEPQEYEDRKIMIGSAYAFQGDERHIIFISMVDAPQDGRPCRAVTSAEKEREFNVAASRAMDQMILFHSASINDLRDTCLQYKLLSHCLNPSIQQLPFGNMTIDDLREKARNVTRIKGNQPEPFDSVMVK